MYHIYGVNDLEQFWEISDKFTWILPCASHKRWRKTIECSSMVGQNWAIRYDSWCKGFLCLYILWHTNHENTQCTICRDSIFDLKRLRHDPPLAEQHLCFIVLLGGSYGVIGLDCSPCEYVTNWAGDSKVGFCLWLLRRFEMWVFQRAGWVRGFGCSDAGQTREMQVTWEVWKHVCQRCQMKKGLMSSRDGKFVT